MTSILPAGTEARSLLRNFPAVDQEPELTAAPPTSQMTRLFNLGGLRLESV